MDMVVVTEADLLLVSGFGLEEFLDDLLAGSETHAELVVISEGIDPLVAESHDHEEDADHDDHEEEADHDDHGEDSDHDDYGEGDHLQSLEGAMGLDPHVWFDPNNILVWVENISSVLGKINPSQADLYQENAADYSAELIELDLWIHEQIDAIPMEHRELVTDHTSLGYFARQYNLKQIGAVIPALTTEAETSGMELAELIDTIEEHQARAIFVGVDFDQTLAQRIAEEAGVPLVTLYFGSLSVGDPAGTYLDFMRYNVKAISEALD
jgi:ABC-type Zn uptake system ZnuABC Zn-binding protein ZnuA